MSGPFLGDVTELAVTRPPKADDLFLAALIRHGTRPRQGLHTLCRREAPPIITELGQ